MSRLDRHVAAVQTKMMSRRFLDALAWSLVALAGLVLLAVVLEKTLQVFSLYMGWAKEHWLLLVACGAGACAVVGAMYALVTKPTREAAAAAIDDKLRLKEKFSTAIYVRPSNDPFAQAAVRDAERTAEGVQLGKQFPLAMPRQAYTAMLLGAAAFGLSFLSPMNLFGNQDPAQKKNQVDQQQAVAKANVDRAIAQVATIEKTPVMTDDLRKLVAELRKFSTEGRLSDPARANRRALQALQDVENQAAKQYEQARKLVEAQQMMMQGLQPPDDAKGPVGEARKEMAKGDFKAAEQRIKDVVDKFDKLTEEQKKEAAKQMEAAAKQLQQMANNPQQQQQVQQQLQQMGANQQQAQQMQQLMQQAAQGGQQGAAAQQQLQQMAQQMAQQMNNGQGANQQQQQAMQQAMQQMQAQAQAQQQAGAMGQAAQQMAQAMQQAQQAGGQGNGQQGAAAQQQMAQAQQQMQQAMGQMGAIQQQMQNQAQQMAGAQQAMQQAQQAANGGQQGGAQGQGQQGQGQQGQGQGQGQFAQGQVGDQQGQGQGGPGIGAGGGGIGKEVAPGSFKTEQTNTQENEKGQVLASYLVRDKADPGKMKLEMAKVAERAIQEAADEVDAEHANRAAQKAAQEYFRTMAKDAPAAPAPAPAPK